MSVCAPAASFRRVCWPMPNRPWSRAILLSTLSSASAACYSGLDRFDAHADTDPAEGQDDDGADDGDDGADDGDDGASSEEACRERSIGSAPLRRLTAAQYDHTIRDLFGIETSYAAAFAPDERIGAFKSNGTAPVGELQVEQYMDAAEAIAQEVVTDLSAILPCDPAVVGEDACADQFLRELAPRTYRRPLQEHEIAAIVDVYASTKAGSDFATGI